MIYDSSGVRPDRPFFTYLSFGAMHAPHQAPPEYLAKYRGASTTAGTRRGSGGPAPTGDRPDPAKAPSWRPATPASSRGTNAREPAAPRRPAAGGVRRVPRPHRRADRPTRRRTRAMDVLDNTVVVVLADNGASQEGGPFGVLHEMKFFNVLLETPDEAVERLDDIGGPHSHTNYPWGWAQCGNTPFRWYKQNTHEGGVHVTDDRALAERHPPTSVAAARPVRQRRRRRPDDLRAGRGHAPESAAWSNCRSPGTRSPRARRRGGRRPATPLQYFEMMGRRALVAGRVESGAPHPGADFDNERGSCTTSPRTVGVPRPGRRQPEKLAELIELWWAEAEDRACSARRPTIELFGARFRDGSLHPADRHYMYRPPWRPRHPSGAGGRRHRWAQLGSAARACTGPRAAVLDRHRELGDERLRPGRPSGGRLQRLRRPPRRVDGRRARRRRRAEGRVPAGRRQSGTSRWGSTASPPDRPRCRSSCG